MPKGKKKKISFSTYLFMFILGLVIIIARNASPESSAAPAEAAFDYNKAGESVVIVSNAAHTGGGTGFIATAASGKRVVITNWHVCEGTATDKKVHIIKQLDYDVLAEVYMSDPKVDLCVISEVPGKPLSVARKSAQRFDALFMLGHPMLHPLTPSQGFLVGPSDIKIGYTPHSGACPEGSKPTATFQGMVCIMSLRVVDTTNTTFPGNSGSPVMNAQGEVVGVMNSTDGATGWGAMVPLEYLNTILGKF